VTHEAREEQEAEAEASMKAPQAKVEGVDADVDADVARQVCEEATCRVLATTPQTGRGKPMRTALRRQRRQN
jgi:hypothetical protein